MGSDRVKRIRGRRGQAIRARLLRVQPLCVKCLERGIARAATQSDHTVPLFKGGKEIDSNRQSLCYDCHEDKTRDDLGQERKQRIGIDGWPQEESEDDR